MKKIILGGSLLISMIFTGSAVNAQGFYTDLNFGYGWGLGETVLGTETYAGADPFIKNLNGTLGSGLNVALTPGYMISDYIGIEIGINYFIGAKTTMEELRTDNADIFKKTVANSNQLRILPGIYLRTGGEQLFAYARTGLVIPVMGSTKVHVDGSEVDMTGTAHVSDVDLTVNGSFTIGFRGALGLGYQISDLLSLNLEVFYTNLAIQKKSQKVDSYTVNGVNAIEGAPTYATEINFVSEINSSSNNSDYNPDFEMDKPKDEIAGKTSFNQFGVSLGLRFNF